MNLSVKGHNLLKNLLSLELSADIQIRTVSSMLPAKG